MTAPSISPARAALLLPNGSAQLVLAGHGATFVFENVTLDRNTAHVSVVGENTSRVSFYANGRTGAIRGTFRNAARRVTTLRGIIYQKTNRGEGTFSDGIELGIFTLVPQ